MMNKSKVSSPGGAIIKGVNATQIISCEKRVISKQDSSRQLRPVCSSSRNIVPPSRDRNGSLRNLYSNRTFAQPALESSPMVADEDKHAEHTIT